MDLGEGCFIHTEAAFLFCAGTYYQLIRAIGPFRFVMKGTKAFSLLILETSVITLSMRSL
ncbi:MAG: hypothetical protein C0523_02345 [Cytophaga sp.]|nr:hypothetical protein [Cytophaga sp.]